MRQVRSICILATAMLIVSAYPARAQTTAVGPYYAVPSWDQTVPCTTAANCPRFVVLSNFNNDAVLDRETGLVWEKSPSDLLVSLASNVCGRRVVGNRLGWRTPTEAELRSLMDASQSPALPAGHPFVNVHTTPFVLPGPNPDLYWTSSPAFIPAGNSITVSFGTPDLTASAPPSLGNFARAWCVRGGAGGAQ